MSNEIWHERILNVGTAYHSLGKVQRENILVDGVQQQNLNTQNTFTIE